MIPERDILIWLNCIGVSNTCIKSLISYFGNLSQLWTYNIDKLVISNIIKPKAAENIISNRNDSAMADFFSNIEKNNLDVITVFDEDYPETLLNIYNNPLVLYKKGKYKDFNQLSIGIVGSRKITSYGRWACERFTKELVELGITIVSGLASGIDAIAHRTALDNGGDTIGVLGNGLDVVYPKSNHALYERIPGSGCIITEFPLSTIPYNYNFPLRNRIISGLSLGVIVVEAQEKSGSIITAHYAMEQGKEVFAVPGNINSLYSSGTNHLIKDGAKMLLDMDDILEEIYQLKQLSNERVFDEIDYSNLSSDEIKIVNVIKDGPIHMDLISIKSGMNISNVNSIVTVLELKGIISEVSSRTFILN